MWHVLSGDELKAALADEKKERGKQKKRMAQRIDNQQSEVKDLRLQKENLEKERNRVKKDLKEMEEAILKLESAMAGSLESGGPGEQRIEGSATPDGYEEEI